MFSSVLAVLVALAAVVVDAFVVGGWDVVRARRSLGSMNLYALGVEEHNRRVKERKKSEKEQRKELHGYLSYHCRT